MSSFTFNQVASNHTIYAAFTADTFSINTTAAGKGNINPSGTVDLTYGGSQAFTFTADSGFHVVDVQVDSPDV